jgi:hypothetical protein
MSNTLTRETVELLSKSRGQDFFAYDAQPLGFVRVKGGYISTHEAMTLVLAGRLDPVQNLQDVAREDFERGAAERNIIAVADKRQRAERERIQTEGIARAKVRMDREAAQQKAYANAAAGMPDGVRNA